MQPSSREVSQCNLPEVVILPICAVNGAIKRDLTAAERHLSITRYDGADKVRV